MGKITNYKDLQVWQRGMTLVETTYKLTSNLPPSEQWGLVSQMRRAAVSVPSNIAEGYGRQSTGQYRQYLSISRGSLRELKPRLFSAGGSACSGIRKPKAYKTRSRRSTECSPPLSPNSLNSCLLPLASSSSPLPSSPACCLLPSFAAYCPLSDKFRRSINQNPTPSSASRRYHVSTRGVTLACRI